MKGYWGIIFIRDITLDRAGLEQDDLKKYLNYSYSDTKPHEPKVKIKPHF